MADTPENPEEMPLHPRERDHLIGHEAAERTFLDAYNQDRLHHAWLITGPKGVGKASLAWRFSKFLQCSDDGDAGGDSLFGEPLAKDARTLDIDLENPVLQRVKSGGHGGIRAIERTVNEKTGKMRNDIVIDNIRGLISFFTQTASEGTWRIAIIDAVDELNVAAANALLKLLEEPPERSILFLVAHSPGKLLPTIRSRCRALSLSPLPTDSVKAVLAGIYPSLPTNDMHILAEMAEGAPGRAVELYEQNGLALYQRIYGILSKAPRFDTPEIHAFAGELGAAKADALYRLFVHLFQGILERMIRSNAAGTEVNEIIEGESALFQRFIASSGLDQWLQLWEKVGQLSARADAVNLDRKQFIISLFAEVGARVRA